MVKRGQVDMRIFHTRPSLLHLFKFFNRIKMRNILNKRDRVGMWANPPCCHPYLYQQMDTTSYPATKTIN